MTGFSTRRLLTMLSCVTALASCADLSIVRHQADLADQAVARKSAIGYDFTRHCRESCRDSLLFSDTLMRGAPCSCQRYIRADSAAEAIAQSLRAFFRGLGSLATNRNIRFNALAGQLRSYDGLNAAQSSAITTLGNLLGNAFVSGIRRKAVAVVIERSSQPVHILADALKRILRDDLAGDIRVREERLYGDYAVLRTREQNTVLRAGVVRDYYRQIDSLDAVRQRISSVVRGLTIMENNQDTLYKYRNRLQAASVRSLIRDVLNASEESVNAVNHL